MRCAIRLLALITPLAMAWQEGPVYRVGGGVTSPTVLTKVDPQYSEEARQSQIGGTVLLELVVGADGLPRNVVVKRGVGYGLDEAARDAVLQWHFKPGLKDGVPVNVQANVEMSFSGKNHPSPTSPQLQARRPLDTQDPTLPAPELLSPADGQILDNYSRSILLQWQSSPGVAQWLVEWDYAVPDGWFAELNHRPGELRPTDAPVLTLTQFAWSKTGRWRVWPINSSQQRGVPSEWRTFQFAR